jgi:hypothetical protein
MEAICPSETTNCFQTTPSYSPKHCNLLNILHFQHSDNEGHIAGKFVSQTHRIVFVNLALLAGDAFHLDNNNSFLFSSRPNTVFLIAYSQRSRASQNNAGVTHVIYIGCTLSASPLSLLATCPVFQEDTSSLCSS